MIFNETRLKNIRPEVIEVVQVIAQRTEKELNRNITVAEGCRSNAVQEAYYAQGRKGIDTVNELRKKAGLPEITQEQNKIITYAPAGTSAHNVCAAVDIYLLTADSKKLESDTAMLKKFYAIIDQEVKKRSDKVVWGGHWTDFKDMPHIEWKHYRTLINKNATAPVVIQNQNQNTTPKKDNDDTLLIIGAAALLGLALFL